MLRNFLQDIGIFPETVYAGTKKNEGSKTSCNGGILKQSLVITDNGGKSLVSGNAVYNWLTSPKSAGYDYAGICTNNLSITSSYCYVKAQHDKYTAKFAYISTDWVQSNAIEKINGINSIGFKVDLYNEQMTLFGYVHKYPTQYVALHFEGYPNSPQSVITKNTYVTIYAHSSTSSSVSVGVSVGFPASVGFSFSGSGASQYSSVGNNATVTVPNSFIK